MKPRITKLCKISVLLCLVCMLTGCEASTWRLPWAVPPALPAVEEIEKKYRAGVYDFAQAEQALEDMARRQAKLAEQAEQALATFRREHLEEYRASLEAEAAACLRSGAYARATEILEALLALPQQ